MVSENDNTERNRKKIATRVIILVTVISIMYLFTCDWNDEVFFHYVINQRTGEPIGFIGSIIIYAFMWGLFGLMISPCITLISMLAFERIDKDAINVFFPIKVTYVAVLIHSLATLVRLSLVDLPSANSIKCCSPPASLKANKMNFMEQANRKLWR